jgi:site-specific DNA recombinase
VTTRAAIYCRISSDREDERLGVDRQEKDCRKLCKEREWTALVPYVDNDISAADPKKKRPAYERMLRDIANHRVDAVVVWDEDRLHRRPIELEEFVKVCESAGMTTMASVGGGGIDLNDDDALMLLRFKAAMAKREVDKIRKRIKRKKLANAESGKSNGGGTRAFGYGRPPTGDTPESKAADNAVRNEVNPLEGVLINEAAKRILEFDTLYNIRKDWIERGIPTVTGKPWSVTAIKAFLTRPKTAGLMQHGKDDDGKPIILYDVECEWEPILPRETWEAVRALLNDPSRAQPKASRDYPLRGILRCSECGRWLSSIPSKKKRQYGCKKYEGGCGHVMISANAVERYVYDILLPLADSPGLRDLVRSEEAGDINEATKLVLENAKDEKQLAQMDNDYADQVIPRATFLKQSNRLRDRIESRTSKLSALRGYSALDRLGGQVQDQWDEMSADDKRMIVQSLVTAIEVSPVRVGLGYFDPTRLKMNFRFESIKKVQGVKNRYWDKDGRIVIGLGFFKVGPEGVEPVDPSEIPSETTFSEMSEADIVAHDSRRGAKSRSR